MKWVWMCVGVIKHDGFASFKWSRKTCGFVELWRSYFLDLVSFGMLLDEIVVVLHACFMHSEWRCNAFSAWEC